MHKIFFIIILFYSISTAQVSISDSALKLNFIYSKIFILNGSSFNKVYFLYSLPYKSLLFEKVSENFCANFELDLEIKDNYQQIIQRKIIKENIAVSNYDITVSDDSYFSDFIVFNLSADTFFINATFTDILKTKSINIFSKKIILKEVIDKFNSLLIKQNYSHTTHSFEIVNRGNIIPHSKQNYDLLIVIPDNYSEVENIIIKEKDSIITDLNFKIIENVIPIITTENNKVLIKNVFQDQLGKNILDSISIIDSTLKKHTIYLLKNINEKLYEGNYQIELSNKNGVIKTIPISVKWIDKPIVLSDYKLALEMIEYIDKINFKGILVSENQKRNILLSYWKQNDPTPQTAFNELMNEFYWRVDYAQTHFISISQKNGAKTDRGRIFILNGHPLRIERNVNFQGKIIETWYYKNPERKFSFIDFKGDGSFKALE